MTGGKLTFSMKTTKKRTSSSSKKPTATSNNHASASDEFAGFEDDDEIDRLDNHDSDLNKEPLVIPVQKDARQSLQEQARQRRKSEQTQSSLNIKTESSSQDPISTIASQSNDKNEDRKDDQAAIDALLAEAEGGISNEKSNSSKMVIEGTEDTFQRDGSGNDAEVEQFQQDLERLAPEVSVDSKVYRQVPISQFGAAMLRGMGWTGSVDTSDKDQNLPRPSRLGLGATPKLLDAPTHGGSRRPRRQDQVQRDEKRRQLQEEYELQRQQQVKLDKQLTVQVGSIVRVRISNTTEKHTRRAIIRQWQGVPGLNMVLVQFEGDGDPSKVKKGDVQLIERDELQQLPFEEPSYRGKSQVAVYLGESKNKSKPEEWNRERGTYREESDERRDSYDHDHGPGQRSLRRSEKGKDKRVSRDFNDDRKHRRNGQSDDRQVGIGKRDDDHSESYEDSKRRRRRDKDDYDLDDRGNDRRKRHRSNERLEAERDRRLSREDQPHRRSTWVIPHIRVRVISSKMGKRYYKEKGVVIDVTASGKATLNMNDGQLLHVPERYLETALPKVGGNACILAGKHRFAKGRLLERDSRANRGAVQVFEDMTIVSTSLDDMAEWCAPLDEDLM